MGPQLLDQAAATRLRGRDRVLVWYNGERGGRVWHERLLVRPVGPVLWLIVTPEGDTYLERLVGGAQADSPVKCVRMINGRVPEGLRGGTHLFTSEVSEYEWDRLQEASEAACGGPPFRSVLLRGESAWHDEAVTPRVPEEAAAFGMHRGRLSMADDSVWLLSSALLNVEGETVYDAGIEMEVVESDLLGSKFGIHFLPSGEEVVVERVPRGLVPRFAPLVRVEVPVSEGAKGAALHSDGAVESRTGLSEKEAVEEFIVKNDVDMRILTVEYDSGGKRRRDWRSRVSAFKAGPLPDRLMSRSRSVKWLSGFLVRLGWSPPQWLERHLAAEGWAPTDRSGHELHVVAQVLASAALYDQLNLEGLASMERRCLRWQAVLEAHTHGPAQADYGTTEAFSEGAGRRVCAASTPQAPGAKKIKDKTVFDKQCLDKKGLRGRGQGGVLRRGENGGGGGDAPAQDD